MKNRQEDKKIQELLGSLEAFPDGIQPNKDALWKRLEPVLAPPKKKNKKVFLWTGMAACIAGLMLFFMMHSTAPLPQTEPAKHQMSATVKHNYLQPEMQELQSIKQSPPPSTNKRKKTLQPQRNSIQPPRTTAKKKSTGTYLATVGKPPLAFDASIPDLIAY